MKKEEKYLDNIREILKNIIELNENKEKLEELEEIKKSMNFSYYDLYEKFKNSNSCYYTDIENLLLELSGSTGSGKSNVNANLMKVTRSLGKAIIIQDAKPDFNNIKLKK